MATDTERNLAVIAILTVHVEELLRNTPDAYGSNNERDAETLRRIGERCRADMEALVMERVMDEGILGDLGLNGGFVLYSDGVDMSAYETKPGES